MYAKIATMTTRQIRPIPIIRVCATWRVPFDLIPVTAAIAVTSTASPSQTIQFMRKTLQEASQHHRSALRLMARSHIRRMKPLPARMASQYSANFARAAGVRAKTRVSVVSRGDS